MSTKAAKKLVDAFLKGTPLDELVDQSRRQFLRQGKESVSSAGRVGGALLAAKAADSFMNPVRATTFGRLPQDTRDSLKFMAAAANLTPADKFANAKLGSGARYVVKAADFINGPINRRDAMKGAAVLSAAGLPAVSPVARVNNLVQSAAEFTTGNRSLKGVRNAAALAALNGKLNTKLAGAEATLGKLDEALETPVTRRRALETMGVPFLAGIAGM